MKVSATWLCSRIYNVISDRCHYCKIDEQHVYMHNTHGADCSGLPDPQLMLHLVVATTMHMLTYCAIL